MLLLGVDERVVGPIDVATTFWARQRGLLGTDRGAGPLWIARCSSIHTLGMRYAVDVAFIDSAGVVLATRQVPPWRGPTRPVRGGRSVVEAVAGTFEGWGLQPGCRVQQVEAQS